MVELSIDTQDKLVQWSTKTSGWISLEETITQVVWVKNVG